MIDEAAIRVLAHEKWEKAGCPEGDGSNFWLEAEQELGDQAVQQAVFIPDTDQSSRWFFRVYGTFNKMVDKLKRSS